MELWLARDEETGEPLMNYEWLERPGQVMKKPYVGSSMGFNPVLVKKWQAEGRSIKAYLDNLVAGQEENSRSHSRSYLEQKMWDVLNPSYDASCGGH